MVISPEAANFTSRRPAAEVVTSTKGTLPQVPTPTIRATTASRTAPHRSRTISSSSSHTVHHLPLFLQPLHLLISGRLPRPLLFTSLGWHIECVEASLRLILSWGIGKNLRVVVECFVSLWQMRVCVANFVDDLSLNQWVVRDGKLILVRALQSQTTEAICSMCVRSILMRSS